RRCRCSPWPDQPTYRLIRQRTGMSQLYDAIGIGYQERRRPDPRLAAAITRALSRAESVVNVGAGSGSYEPTDPPVVAVEPAMTIIRQRRAGAAPVAHASPHHRPFHADR